MRVRIWVIQFENKRQERGEKKQYIVDFHSTLWQLEEDIVNDPGGLMPRAYMYFHREPVDDEDEERETSLDKQKSICELGLAKLRIGKGRKIYIFTTNSSIPD